MAEDTRMFSIGVVGGLNSNDQSNLLVHRSHTIENNDFRQLFPVESPDMDNIDFDSQGITKRLGSTESDDLTGVDVTDEELMRGFEFRAAASGSRIEVVVGKKSVYTNQSGSFAQINNANGNPYVHSADVSKVTFAFVDGHLFIGLDNGNPILVYRTGANLDDLFYNDDTAVTVDADSASGQTVLNVDVTTGFTVGARVRINSGGARDETGYIASIQAGTSITLEDNLTFTHTAAQADAVIVENLYTEAYDTSITNAITGAISTGNYLVATLHSRIVFSDGNTLVNWTPTAETASSGIWDYAGAGSGFYQSAGNVRSLITFVPKFTDSLDESLYIGTSAGFEITTGFDSGDKLVRIEGSKSPLNHQSFCKAKNWIVYLTDDKNIIGINASSVIDLGRRAKSTAADGKLDDMNISESDASSFGFYNSEKEQCFFFFDTASNRVNDRCLVVDLQLGEPTVNEAKEQFESRIRLLNWNIDTPDTNDWFSGMYQTISGVKGIRNDSKLYLTENGTVDLDTLAIAAYWYSPVFTGGHEIISKQWMQLGFRGIVKGSWPLYVDIYLDRDTTAFKTWDFSQGQSASAYGTGVYGTATYTSTNSIKGNNDTDLYTEAIQWRLYNEDANETFLISTQSLQYLIGAEER